MIVGPIPTKSTSSVGGLSTVTPKKYRVATGADKPSMSRGTKATVVGRRTLSNTNRMSRPPLSISAGGTDRALPLAESIAAAAIAPSGTEARIRIDTREPSRMRMPEAYASMRSGVES